MTLRLRLLLIIGLAFALVWTAASLWMLRDFRVQFRAALDERLAASARMVAGLVAELPASSPVRLPPHPSGSLAPDGVACEISLLKGDIVARTENSPGSLSGATPGYSTRFIDGVQWRTYTLHHGDVRVTTADRVDRREHLLRKVVLATGVPFLLAAIGSLAALAFGIRRGLEPLRSVGSALAEREPDALEPVPGAGVPAELAPLVSAMNALLERMRDALERERAFTDDAAHELRTPLTAIKTHVQVARRAGGGSETAQALEHAEEGVRRLQHTLEQLLMLARVEAPHAEERGERTSAGVVMERALHAMPPEERPRVMLEHEDAQVRIAAPAALAVVALRNLLDNALRHSPADARVVLRVRRGDDVLFQVEDQGPGMKPDDLTHATQRFWRRGPGQSSGLGLSIVAAVARRYGGKLRLLPGRERGLVAELTLPCG